MSDDSTEWLARQPDPSDADGYARWPQIKQRVEHSHRQLQNGEYTEYDKESLRKFFDDLIRRVLAADQAGDRDT